MLHVPILQIPINFPRKSAARLRKAMEISPTKPKQIKTPLSILTLSPRQNNADSLECAEKKRRRGGKLCSFRRRTFLGKLLQMQTMWKNFARLNGQQWRAHSGYRCIWMVAWVGDDVPFNSDAPAHTWRVAEAHLGPFRLSEFLRIVRICHLVSPARARASSFRLKNSIIINTVNKSVDEDNTTSR